MGHRKTTGLIISGPTPSQTGCPSPSLLSNHYPTRFPPHGRAPSPTEVATSFSRLSRLFQFGGLGVRSHYFCIAVGAPELMRIRSYQCSSFRKGSAEDVPRNATGMSGSEREPCYHPESIRCRKKIHNKFIKQTTHVWRHKTSARKRNTLKRNTQIGKWREWDYV